MKKKVVSLLICSALMMVEGITTYAQTLSVNPTDSNKATVESPSESKDQVKEKETSELLEDESEDTSLNPCKKKEKEEKKKEKEDKKKSKDKKEDKCKEDKKENKCKEDVKKEDKCKDMKKDDLKQENKCKCRDEEKAAE